MIRIFRKEFIIGIVGVAVCLCADAFSDVVVLLMEITPMCGIWLFNDCVWIANRCCNYYPCDNSN